MTILQHDEGMRARKQRATSSAIHLAALALVAEHGLENVTVATIAAEADVSTRTFFNYFPCKEDAVTGVRGQFETAPIDAFAAATLPPSDYLAEVTELTRIVFASAFIADRADETRRELMTRYPHLNRRAMSRIGAIELAIAPAVATRIIGTGGIVTDDVAAEDVAAMLVMVASSTVRFAIRRNIETQSSLSASAVDEAVTVLRSTMRSVL